ncbi:MAG: DNA-binding domain-containing protein [Nibricoccus sp.]
MPKTRRRPAEVMPDLEPRDLAAWQRTMHAAITRPLAPGDRAQRRWFDGGSTARAMAKLVKPSRTLQPVERVEIYNRMYWFRILDSLAQDFPGLKALLGDKKFWKLAETYLAVCPSRSFTLRDLGSRLEKFIASEAALVEPYLAAALDMTHFEWAQIVAFDGPSKPKLRKAQFEGTNPNQLQLGLQPYLTILNCRHPVDEFVLAVKRDGALRTEASNAVLARIESTGEVVELRRGPILYLAVHRMDNQLYYKRLDREAAVLLRALRAGRTLAEACAAAFARSKLGEAEQAETLKQWFSLWMRLGWLCARE